MGRRRRRRVNTFALGMSNAILPARAPGEPPLLPPWPVKREKENDGEDSVNSEDASFESSDISTVDAVDTLSAPGNDSSQNTSASKESPVAANNEECKDEKCLLKKRKAETENLMKKKVNTELVDNDKNCQAIKEEDDSDDVVILAVAEVKRNILVVTVPDEDSEPQDVIMEELSQHTPFQTTASTKPKNKAPPDVENLDILKYFNLVGEISRDDCQTALMFLSDKSVCKKNILRKYFPMVKKEKESRKIVKDVILFEKVNSP